MNNKITFVAIVIALVAVVGAVFVFMANRDAEGETNGVQDNNSTEPEDFDLQIDMSNFKFSKTVIEAAPGETIKIKLVSKGGTHDFVIDELDVNSGQISTGRSKIFTLEIPDDAEPGDYEFYCSVEEHRMMGMVGTLRVK